MLENDFVGQRSGTSQERVLTVSQNQRKVRRSRSSTDDGGDATARLREASAAVWQEAPKRMRRAAKAALHEKRGEVRM
jgi:hypothetical protein